nr:hypothetical protein [Tanacetum cinerariifolium]
EKQVSIANKSVEVRKHVNVENSGLESLLTVSEAHGIHSPFSNKENMNDVGTTVGPTTADNTHGMSSYANVIGAPSRKALNFHTLFTLGGNEVDVVVLVKFVRAISDQFANATYGSSYARALIEVWAEVELKDNILVAMPKLVGEGFFTCIVQCLKNFDSDVVKNMKKPGQALRSVSVGLKGKPLKKVAYLDDHDSKDEVELVDNDMTCFMALERVSFDTNSLLEQLRDTYENADYDYDLYEDDTYEGQEIFDKIRSICDNLDITVQGRKKK